MDEDLKIILTSELEADEQASAQRISAQLPNIAKLINSRSSIKVGVSLDESTVRSDTQRISQQIARATQSQTVGVSLSLDQSSVNKIRAELNNLKVSPDISRAMTDQLDRMGIQIDRITGRWETVNGEQERMLNLTIQGTDQMQRTVTYLQTYDAETGEISTNLTNVTTNLERQRKAQEQLAAQAQKDNESRLSYLNRQKSVLQDIQAAYAGQTSVKPVTDSDHLTRLNEVYSAVNKQIENMIATEGRLDNVQRSNLESQIAGLQRLVKEYQNAEYVATKLRTKDIGSIKSDQLSGLIALEKRLESAGTLTDAFASKIDALKSELSNVGTKDQLVAFLNNFDQLNNDVAVFQERLRGANQIYTQLISLDKQITSVQSEMLRLNPDSDRNKLAALEGQLAVLNNQRTSLESQLAPYADIVQYAKQATALEQSRLLNGSKLVTTQMALADKAREYDAAMRGIPSVINDLQTKYRQVVSPTESLVQNMRQLRDTAAQYTSDMGDREKVETYERLQTLIGAVSKEISQLIRIQRGEVNDFKFTQNLEKAKADLETVGRTWSALKGDPGLNAQFQQLSQNLTMVNNQMDLNKWNAQFSTFKSEVKAAGLNMQSLGDILKNNVGKVLQWVSATTLLFRAFGLLRQAVDTVIALDTAMIDLRKTTTATEEEYRQFYLTANETAKALGVTTEEIISQTAEWSRLGYSMQEAAKLAENSAIFRAVSPEMDISMATDGLVSIIKAFDIDVNDSLDGIVSKVNAVGNAFAVSNADVVEALTRSSAAMAVANNTFDETVALATAAIEITRDASSVGNALKTISMRIRGYDEETEEYVGGVQELTGAIADLTKTASNPTGVSLFEEGDPDTYRSTYDILADIADIWDELTDKNRANLLETLFGKQRAQVGAAMLSNFDQAKAAIDTMMDSAGSAEAEMENIYQSLEYKLNALQQTWVGVAQNLLGTDDMKLVVEVLTVLSEAVDKVTESLGLFGTVGLIVVIAQLVKFRSTISTINSAITPVLNTLSSMNFDGSTASVLSYASALAGLDPVQQKLAMTMAGLNSQQQQQITTMLAAIVAMQQYTVAELEQVLGLEAGTIANELNIASTERVTIEILKAAVANGKLTQAQMEQILATNKQTATNNAAGLSFSNLGKTAGAAWKSMSALSKFSLVAGVVTTAISLISAAWNYFSEQAERAAQRMQELDEEYQELQSTISSAASEYRSLKTTSEEIIPRFVELAEGVDKFGKNVSLTDEEYAEFLDLNNRLAEMFPEINMGMDSNGNAMLTLSYSADTLRDSLLELVEAQREAANAEIAETMPDVLENIQNSNDAYRDEIDKLKDIQDEYRQVYEDFINRSLPTNIGRYSTKEAGAAAAEEFIAKAKELGISGSVYLDDQQSTNNGYVFSVEWDYTPLEEAGQAFLMPYIDEQYEIALQRYDKLIEDYQARIQAKWNQLNPVVSSWMQTDFMFQDLNDPMQEIAEAMISGLDFSSLGLTTQEEVQQYVDDNIVEPLFLAAPEVKSAFENLTDWKEQLASGDMTEDEFSENVTNAFNGIFDSMLPENVDAFKTIFVAAFNEMGIAGDDFGSVLDGLIDEWSNTSTGAEGLNAELTVLTDTLSSLKSAYNVLEQAQDDMASGGLTAETIEELARQEENYLDYLYEENGVVKLNVDAWKERANAQMLGDISSIENQIDGIEEQNEALRENIEYYEEQRQLGNDGGLWTNLISEATSKIEENNAAIAENQSKLAIYKSLFNEITGGLGTMAETLDTFDQATASLKNLAKVQDAVSSGYRISVQQARELAEVYPEILAQATTAANGEIQLNQAVVNSFIATKQGEVQTAVNAEILKLQAKEALLQAELGIIESQIKAAETGNSEEVRLANESAAAQIALEQAVLSACEQAGIDEATANQLALAAMTGDWDTFTSLAGTALSNLDSDSAIIFNSVMSNFAITAQNMVDNTNTVIGAFSKMGLALQNAMKGITTTQYGGTTSAEAVSAAIREDVDGLISDMFEEEKSDYTDTEGDRDEALEKWKEELQNIVDDYASVEPDLDSLYAQRDSINEQIASVQGQIALLQSLKNTPLSQFGETGTTGSTTGTDVEEYIAEIDQYREAIERLRKAQEQVSDIELRIEESDDIREKILLTRQLIGAYEREQDALSDLNKARSATIQASVESLRELGFAVEYNAETNDLWISNMEHLNELTADNKGEYDSLQEATNALRENTEDLINTITDLNEENRDGASTWRDVAGSISDAREQITEYLNEIVEQASNAVDTVQNVYDTLHDAADEYAASGFITVDTLQSIIGLGQQYVAYLIDENGQLVINEERIKAVIAARTQQMAIESSLAYVEALRMAKAEGDIATLNNLLYATEAATNATWGFVYANLALAGLDANQYQAALQNINAIRALADSAVQSIGQTVGGVTEELEEMQQGLTDILEYVMDMLKQRVQDQIDGLEDMKDAYSEIIELKKESLQASKDEADYQKSLASKMREIAKLQARIDALSLDDSREAQAERAGLLEELNELQGELTDDQADRTLEAQEDALDKMEESYHDEKDREIAILEDSISSYQKLYDMAIEYIESHWDTLYNELIAWNTQYGSVLNSEITTAWDNALAAAQRYGSYVSALGSIGGDIEASQSTGMNTQVGNTNYDNTSNSQENIHAIIKAMYANGQLWGTASDAQKKQLADKNLQLGSMLAAYGITAVRGEDGVWYIDRVGGEELFKKYKQYIYHDGGIVGGGDVKSNEQISLLKDKEWVLNEQMVKNLVAQMDVIRTLADGMGDLPDYVGNSALSDIMKQVGTSKTVNNVTNNSRPIEVQIGDTIIHGADQSTVEQHIKVTRDMVNQIGRIIGIGR